VAQRNTSKQTTKLPCLPGNLWVETLVFILHQTPERQLLHKRVRVLEKRQVLRTQMYENGDILATLYDGSRVSIRSEEDLARLRA